MKVKRIVWISIAALMVLSMLLSACQPASETVVPTEARSSSG